MKILENLVLLSFLLPLFVAAETTPTDPAMQLPGKHNFCGPSRPIQAQSPTELVRTLYQIVSGSAEEQRDWQLLANLMAPDARITPLFHSKDGVKAGALTVPEFIKLNKKLFSNQGFYETETSHTLFQFGHMAHILSYFSSRKTKNAPPYSKGVNSFQLLNDGSRWCVISATWDSDLPQHPISTAQTVNLTN